VQTQNKSVVNEHLHIDSMALAEVIAYIEDTKFGEVTPSVFKLTELCQLYAYHLRKYAREAGVQVDSGIHSSRFKERLLSSCPNLTAVPYGRDVFLSFRDDIGVALHHVMEQADSDAVHLMHTVKLIRNEVFSHACNFTGSLSDHSKAVPSILQSFVTMLLEGPGNTEISDTEAALSVAQLIMFNAIKRRRNTISDEQQKPVTIRHSVDRETPLPIYMGLMLHSATRKKKLVDRCHKLGLSISYSRC